MTERLDGLNDSTDVELTVDQGVAEVNGSNTTETNDNAVNPLLRVS
jgi:hypothetical protein